MLFWEFTKLAHLLLNYFSSLSRCAGCVLWCNCGREKWIWIKKLFIFLLEKHIQDLTGLSWSLYRAPLKFVSWTSSYMWDQEGSRRKEKENLRIYTYPIAGLVGFVQEKRKIKGHGYYYFYSGHRRSMDSIKRLMRRKKRWHGGILFDHTGEF